MAEVGIEIRERRIGDRMHETEGDEEIEDVFDFLGCVSDGVVEQCSAIGRRCFGGVGCETLENKLIDSLLNQGRQKSGPGGRVRHWLEEVRQ